MYSFVGIQITALFTLLAADGSFDTSESCGIKVVKANLNMNCSLYDEMTEKG